MPSSKTTPRRPRGPAAAPWLVYILLCRDGSLYTGITNDLPRRLRAHAAGKASRYTRSRLPVRPVYAEPQATKSLALKREAAIKALARAQKLRLVADLPARSGLDRETRSCLSTARTRSRMSAVTKQPRTPGA